METNISYHIIAYHGWGFDATCWKEWKENVQQSNLEAYFSAADRGYFGKDAGYQFDASDSKNILFTHSYGLHWCPREELEKADMLVVISGFLYFHPHAAQFRRRSRLMVSRMLENLHSDPEKVLYKFRENCYLPEPVVDREEKEQINLMKLIQDLGHLNQVSMPEEKLQKIPKICILHGSKDRIVSKKKGREIYNRIQGRVRYFEIKDSGHAVPFTQPDRCWSFIEPEIETL